MRRCLAIVPMFLTTASLHAEEVGVGKIDFMEVFQASPIIYSILLTLSISSVAVWLYSFLTLKEKELMPEAFINNIRELLTQRHYEAALSSCEQEGCFSSSIIASGIIARKHGPQVMMDAMQSEGRRQGSSLWQRISLLNDIAVIAPMFGLLGTVVGLFFAFYSTEKTTESLASIFDGLGIAVGTTVVGLIVAIMAMIFYTSLKFRIIALLNKIENETVALVNMVEEG